MILPLAALWVAVYGATVLTALTRRARVGNPKAPPYAPTWMLLRPCAGDEPGLEDRLAESAGADRVVFAVATETDAALPAARRAAERLRRWGARADVVVTGAQGPNRKADQLARALDDANEAGVVVVADSDVDLGGADLATLAARAADPRVGAVWLPPVEVAPAETAGDRASQAVLNGSLHAFPLLSAIDPSGLVGKLFALRLDVLERVGGFASLRRHLGEDMELARRLRSAGLAIETSPGVARSVARGRALADVRARYARWLMVIRAQRAPLLVAYPLLLAPFPVIAALFGAAAVTGKGALVLFGAAALAVRLAVGIAALRAAGARPTLGRALADAALADGLLVVALATCLASRTVRWRDGTLVVGARGLLEEVAR